MTAMIETHHSPLKPILTPQEAADLLQIGRTTLEAMRRRGGGPPFIKLAYNCVRYGRADVLAWAETKRRSSNHEHNFTADRSQSDG